MAISPQHLEKSFTEEVDKLEQKIDYTHSGYSGGDRHTKYKDLMATRPERAVKIAVKGMLPHNRLADRQIVRLKIFKGEEHTLQAQYAIKKETK